MKKKIFLLFVVLTVATLCLAACVGPSVNDLQKINEQLKVDYSKITVVTNTKTETVELSGTFTLTFDGDETKIDYDYERLNTFDVDGNGNVANADGDFLVREKGTAVVRDNVIVNGENVAFDLAEIDITGFSFKQAFFSKASFKGAKFEADVVAPQKFTGNLALNCTDMHVVVIRNVNAGTLTSIELTYTSENGAAVKINYLFTK